MRWDNLIKIKIKNKNYKGWWDKDNKIYKDDGIKIKGFLL